ncbi:hypothetical protein N2152v2_000088 [Parachlorella kessleri]
MLVSRRFLEAGCGCPELWHTASCGPSSVNGMSSVLAWVAAHKQHVRRFSLRQGASMQPAELLPFWGLVTCTFVLASPTLISLDVLLMADLEVSAWVAPLTNLRWLSATARHITVTASVGALKQLTTLQLNTLKAENANDDTIVFAPNSIPVGLQALVLEEMVLSELPPAITRAAASLTRLRLDVNYSEEFALPGPKPGSIRGLGPLGALTALEVLEVQRSDLASIPEDISALTRLAQVCLSWGFQSHRLIDMHLLGRLPGLVLLNLQYCQLATLGDCMSNMRALCTLVVSGNPGIEFPSIGPWLAQLVQLDLDLESATRNLGPLLSMLSLEELCIGGSRPRQPLSAPSVVAFLRALARLPRLASLLLRTDGQQQLTRSVELVAELAEFLRSRPGVKLSKSALPSLGSPFGPHFLTWDQADE